MREIKFRAWDGKQMIADPALPNSDNLTVSINEIFSRQDYKFMQFTGLKDKNGVEIYEGDIVQTLWRGHRLEGQLKDAGRLVGFGQGLQGEPADWEGPFWGWILGEDEPLLDTWDNLEVIGNIYENPELLEEKKK